MFVAFTQPALIGSRYTSRRLHEVIRLLLWSALLMENSIFLARGCAHADKQVARHLIGLYWLIPV